MSAPGRAGSPAGSRVGTQPGERQKPYIARAGASGPRTEGTPAPGCPRLPRCRLLDHLGNRCSNEEIDAGLCAHHMAEAARAFRQITEGKTSDDHTIAA